MNFNFPPSIWTEKLLLRSFITFNSKMSPSYKKNKKLVFERILDLVPNNSFLKWPYLGFHEAKPH